ncbi:MAG: hypothetical protein EA341_18655 [Mongoliibacter sp.]|nr:MAG: hypothetical protein EA341_18655 [Mongoliibacter sp.]
MIDCFQRFTFNPRIFAYPGSRTEIGFGLNFNYEDRKGGNMALLRNESTVNTCSLNTMKVED